MLLEMVFEKAHGAPVAREKPNRSRPQNELKMTSELEPKQKQKPRFPTSTYLRACRALTVWRLCGGAGSNPLAT
jgi:hypothetical protein